MIKLPDRNMPMFLRRTIETTLAYEHVTPDHALFLADILDRMASDLPDGSIYIDSLKASAHALRDEAPNLDTSERRSLTTGTDNGT